MKYEFTIKTVSQIENKVKGYQLLHDAQPKKIEIKGDFVDSDGEILFSAFPLPILKIKGEKILMKYKGLGEWFSLLNDEEYSFSIE